MIAWTDPAVIASDLDKRAARDMRRSERRRAVCRKSKPAPVPELPKQFVGGLAEAALDWFWGIRKCFVCGEYGQCAHRESELDLAKLAAISHDMRSAA